MFQIRSITSLLFLLPCLATSQLNGQNAIPRLFLDAPEIFIGLPNINQTQRFDRAGVGASVAMNVATYNAVARLGGRYAALAQPKAEDFGASVVHTYGGFLEGGAGLYRSNGQRCAKDRAAAFTAMAVGGVRYDLSSEALLRAGDRYADGFDYTGGVELGYFFIKDIIKNTEFTLRGDYHFKQELISVKFGIKVFWNLKGER